MSLCLIFGQPISKPLVNDIVADEENDDISIVVSPTDSKESRVDTLNYSEHLVQVGGGIMLTSLTSAHE